MAGEKPDKDSDEKRFNETLKRMLKTPPKPHDKKDIPRKVGAQEAKKQPKT
ncbi:hypothetical protein [Mesorhizobium sp. WSM3868]|uniref:hypothetical protein n=1 Tax=Mesorhizobium sp. WSM3868 TaxID=2029405 RepID=UPI0015CD8855|nr:hypothetical protein [Mesorhizobium sp. WSM3868]